MESQLLGLSTTALMIVIGAWLSYHYAVRQKNYDALIQAKLRHYERITPHLNRIFRYRQRVGDYMDLTPEQVLDAKRQADEEFYVHLYIWSDEFRRAYRSFMGHSFLLFVKPRALIRAERRWYQTPAHRDWAGFSDEPVDQERNMHYYHGVMSAIADDLPFVRPLGVRPQRRWEERTAPTAADARAVEEVLQRKEQRAVSELRSRMVADGTAAFPEQVLRAKSWQEVAKRTTGRRGLRSSGARRAE